MFLATMNKPRRLLHLSYINHVSADEIQQGMTEVLALASEMPAGFRLLTDFDRLESMDQDCALELGKLMDLIKEMKVELVVRVIPDPQKDIGMNIITLFHYHQRPKVATCKTMEEAARELGL